MREMCLYDKLLLRCEVVALTPEMNLGNSILYVEKMAFIVFILSRGVGNLTPFHMDVQRRRE